MIKKTKHILALGFWFLAFGFSVFAQAPQGINYQAVARDVNGNPIATQTVSLEFKIHQTSSSGTVVYDETYSKTTNQFGLFTAVIGQGTPLTGVFTSITWATNLFWLEVIVNGTSMIPITQLMSVPYSLFSANSGFSNMQVFNASGNFVIPPGVTTIMVEVWGGGGSGGSPSGAGSMSSGGGGGGYGKGTYTVTPSSNYTVTIGAGGSVGALAAAGSAGGTSSFGSLISATGGAGGTTNSAMVVGVGGSSSAPFNISGGTGFTGCTSCSGFALLPHGGVAGNGGAGGSGFANAPGGLGIAPGGGGGGSVGTPPNLGGVGASGRVVVWL